MILRFIALLITGCAALGAAHDAIGTWKLDLAKSKYSGGMLKPKAMTVTYTPEGTGWRYEATGLRGDGQPAKASFVYVTDGAEIKTTGFPYWDALILKNAGDDVSTGTLMRGGKAVGSVKRSFSDEGKTMTISGDVELPDGKKARYTSVYRKQ
jgi:hypothetical protein